MSDGEAGGRMDFLGNVGDYKQYLDMCESQEYQKLQQFYNRKTLFDILGVARQENPHSSFWAWLLDPGESHRMGDFPIKQFLKTVCLAYLKYPSLREDDSSGTENYLRKAEIVWSELAQSGETGGKSGKRAAGNRLTEEELQRAAEKKLLFYDQDPGGEKAELRKKLMQGNYEIEDFNVRREKLLSGWRRADIFIEFTVRWGGGRRREKRLIAFIENKVTSDEHDKQTVNYTHDLLGDDALDGAYIIPVYLYVSSNKEMMEAARSSELPCKSRLFLLLNYQYLMDGVLSPCLTRFSDDPVADVLRDYVTCLGKSIEVETTGKKKSSTVTMQITMAVGSEEKRWSAALWKNHRAVLMEACRELIGGTPSGKGMQGEEEGQPEADRSSAFLTATDADEQFYRTVLNSVPEYLGAADKEKEDLEKLKQAKRTNKKPIFFVKQRNGAIWKFVSASRGGSNMGALAYVLLRQYIETNPSQSAEEIRTKLAIKSNWLGSMLVTRDELRDFLIKWANADHPDTGPACKRYLESGCPLAHRERPDDKDCPLNKDVTNEELRKAVYGSGYYKCWCIYDFVHSFFTGGIEKPRNWGKANGRDLSEFFSAPQEVDFLNQRAFGLNKNFGPIKVDGWADGFAYVARYWGASTIETLKGALKMEKYVAPNFEAASKLTATLNFDQEDCVLDP